MKEELITRAIAALTIMFLGVTIGPSLLRSVFSIFKKDKKRGGGNLEAMIAMKETEMRKGMKKPTSSGSKKTKSAAKNNLADASAQAASQAAKDGDKERQKDFMAMTKICDQLQWGPPDEWNRVQKRLTERYQLKTTVTEINDLFKKLSLNKSLLNNPLTLSEWIEILAGAVFFKKYVTESLEGKGQLSDKLAVKWSMNKTSIRPACLFFAGKLSGYKSSDMFSMIEKKSFNLKQDKIDQAAVKLITKYKSQAEHMLALIESDIKDQAFIFDSLKKLPAPPKTDKKTWALKVFGLSENAGSDQIKKRYKLLASKKHPDKLSAKGLSSDQLKQASENFSLLQEAYDVLKKEKG